MNHYSLQFIVWFYEHFLILSSRQKDGEIGIAPGTSIIRFHPGFAVLNERTCFLLAWDPSATNFLATADYQSVLTPTVHFTRCIARPQRQKTLGQSFIQYILWSFYYILVSVLELQQQSLPPWGETNNK